MLTRFQKKEARYLIIDHVSCEVKLINLFFENKVKLIFKDNLNNKKICTCADQLQLSLD